MPDSLGHDSSIFGLVGQSLSDEMSLFMGDPLASLLSDVHEGVGESGLAFEINDNGLRTRETGLEAWIKWQEEQRERQLNQGSGIDPVTGLIPTVSTPSASSPASSTSLDVSTEVSSSDPPSSAVPTPSPQRIEAETMALSGDYEIADKSFASGDQLIRLPQKGEGGSAESTFTGASGTYAVVVGYHDESDGTGSMSLDVGDTHIEWSLDQGDRSRRIDSQSFVRQVVSSAVELEPGDTLRLSGVLDGKEQAAIDYIELIPVDPTVSLPFRVEAEDTSLEGYEALHGRSFASSGGLAKITDPSVQAGISRFAFPKQRGYYDVVVGYYDHKTGTSEYTLSVGGQDYQWLGDKTSGANWGEGALTRRTVVEGVLIDEEGVIELKGLQDQKDTARIDYLEFIPSERSDSRPGAGISVLSGEPSTPIEPEQPPSTPLPNEPSTPPLPSDPVTLSVTSDPSEIATLKNDSTKLWSAEGRGGGTTTYEFAIGPNGAQADLHQQAEHIWENGVDVPWSLEWQGNQAIFTIAGQQMNYPIGEVSRLDGLSLLTKVNSSSSGKVSVGTRMALAVTAANGTPLNNAIELSSEGPTGGQDLDELFIRSDGEIGTLSGTAQLSWPDDGVNPHSRNSQSRVSFQLSGYRNGVNTPPPTPDAPEIRAFLQTDSGLSQSDGLTNDASISGTLESDAEIVHFQAALNDASALEDIQGTLNPDGSFRLDPTELARLNGGPLSDGDYTVYLQAEDSNGHRSAITAVPFTLDSSAPDLTLDTPLDGADHSPTARLIGTVLDGGGTSSFNGTFKGTLNGNSLDGLTPDSTGHFDQRLSNALTNGSHTLTLTATDAAGNETTVTRSFDVSDAIVVQPRDSDGWGIRSADGLRLGEQNSSRSQVVVPIELGQPNGSRIVRFDLDTLFDTSDQSTLLEDQLLVYLTDSPDSTQTTLLNSGKAGGAVFSISGEQVDFAPGLVSYDGGTVEIDVTSLSEDADGQGYLIFQLVNHDGDIGSQIQVSNLSNTVDPEGVERPVFPMTNRHAQAGASLVLESLNRSSDIDIQLNHVRVDSRNGQLRGELSIRNGVTAIGRQVAVVFDDLPEGVQLMNASGVDADGNPYINLANAIRPGGLDANGISDVVEVVFDNPNQERLPLSAHTLIGGANQAPTLGAVGTLSVMPGERLVLPLAVSDPDGDRVTVRIESESDLPNGSLKGSTLTFAPTPDQVGTHTFTLVATDGALETRQEVTLEVAADPITTTRVSGIIENTDQDPLEGVVIELNGIQTTTDANGRFTLDGLGELDPINDALIVRGNDIPGDEVYPFIPEKLHLLMSQGVFTGVNNVIDRPIYLPAIDVASGQVVDPTQDMVITTDAIPGAAVTVAAGSLGNFSGVLSITAVSNDLTPAALPPHLSPDLVVTIQPGEMEFQAPAPLDLPNLAGYAPGTLMDLWSINPNTGDFDNVGMGRVSDDGSVVETIEGGIINSSWHFFAPPPPDLDEPEDDPDECDECEASASFTSQVQLDSGAVIETHDLVSYQSQGHSQGFRLTYDSLRADARPILDVGGQTQFTGSDGVMAAELTIRREGFEYQVPGYEGGEFGFDGGEHFWQLNGQGRIHASLQADLRGYESGRYDYDITSGIYRFTDERAVGSSSTVSGQLLHVNTVNSAFGAGWGLAGLQELVANPDGSLLLIDGDGSEQLFEAPIEDGGAYVGPPSDFSVLEQLANGSFRRTMKDQTVYTFNANYQLVRMENRHGQGLEYRYDPQGRFYQIVDSVGQTTTFGYTGERITTITDPAKRVTQLKYDAAGNLYQIVDPDETARTFEYDRDHHMTAEVDQEGYREEAFYDFAGRATRAIRKDGSVVQVNPVQVQGLYRPEETSRLDSAPILGQTKASVSFYADGGGNTIRQRLDRIGQQISAQDGVGVFPLIQRNGQNQVESRISSRGNVTEYTYDEQGNILSTSDSLSPRQNTSQESSLFSSQVYQYGGYSLEDVSILDAVDLNQDGRADIVGVDGNTLTILLGNMGGYADAQQYTLPISSRRVDIAFGDLNGDGAVDIALLARESSFADHQLMILPGNGDGTFTESALETVSFTGSGLDLVVDDFNMDGISDVAVSTRDSLNIFLSTGDVGIPLRLEQYYDQYSYGQLISGDLNNDGRADIVSMGQDGVVALFSNTQETFDEHLISTENISSGFLGHGIGTGVIPILANVNQDSNDSVDIIIAHGQNLTFLFNNGDNSFEETRYISENEIVDIAFADADGNGTTDVITYSRDGVLSYLNNGFGIIGEAIEIGLGVLPRDPLIGRSLVSSDWNGDGYTDIALLNREFEIYSGRDYFQEGSIRVLLGSVSGEFSSAVDYPVGDSPVGLMSIDVNQDGNLDLVSLNQHGNLFVLLSDGDGTFDGATHYPELPSVPIINSSRSNNLELVDFNNDGLLDLVNQQSNTVSVALGTGTETFRTPQVTDLGDFRHSIYPKLIDIDQDNILDIVFVDNGVASIFRGNADGSLSQDLEATELMEISSFETKFLTGDIDGDNSVDLVFNSRGNLHIFRGNSNESFESSPSSALVFPNYLVNYSVLGDIDGDGDLDLITSFDDGISIAHNDSVGNFERLLDYRVGEETNEITIVDVNADGHQDLLLTHVEDGFSIMLGQADGTLSVSEIYDIEQLSDIAVSDMNGDGYLDIIASSYDEHSPTLVVKFGDGTGDFRDVAQSSFITRGNDSFVIGDIDGDGDEDVVTVPLSSYRGTPEDGYIHFNHLDAQEEVSNPDTSTRYTYDETFNQVTSITDELGRQTLYEIDPVTGQRLSMTQVVGELDTPENGETDDVKTRYTYIARGEAAAGQIDTQTDALGRVTDYDYDDLGRLERVTYAKNTVDEAVESYEYDGAGNRRAVIDANGNRTEYTYYEGTNRVKTITSAVGTQVEATQSFEYDKIGRQTAVVDGEGHRTEYRYDAMGRQTHIIEADPDGVEGPLESPVSQSVYDNAGNLIERIDPLGRVTRYVYDARDRLIETILPDESVLKTGYDADNNRSSSTGVDGRSTQSFYDLRGRLIRTIDELQRETKFEYDVADQMIAQTDANGVRTEYEYDDLGRRIAVTTAAGTDEAITTRIEYDKVGNVVAEIDGLKQRTEYVYDDRNRRIRIIDVADDSGVTRFSYDAVGNLKSITDSEENTTSYIYDERNRLKIETNELLKTRSFEYDKNGNRTQVTDRNNRVIKYDYDDLNRQTSEQWLDENGQVVNEIVTVYDAADQVTAVSDAHSAYTFTYDALGYQDRVDNTGFNGMPQVVLDYDYDAEGKLESVTEIIEGVEGATTRYDYDERDQVKSITQSGNGTSDKRVEFDYSPIGQFEGIRRYSDVDGTQLVAATDYDYDEHNRLESLTHNNGANESLAFYDFAYDEAHRIDAITDVDGTTDYDYDQTNQLISAQHSDVDKPDESYDYDKNGNRIESHRHGTDYVTGENNQLNSDGIYTYTYDDQGNMKTQTAIATGIVEEFEWDYRNRLTSIITRDDTGTVTQEVNYVYDVVGRRIAKTLDPDGDGATSATTTHFVYDGNNVLMEFVDDSSTPSQRYLHGPQVDQVLAQDDGSGQPLWLLADHLGTVHDVVDNSGTVVNHITFDSFGNVLNQTDDTFSTRYLFTGREFDTETGLYYYRARYYNSEIGQFISQDPIGFGGGLTNLYSYVGNNSISFSDPSGLLVEGIFDLGTGLFTLTDKDTGETVIVNGVFSGDSEYSPIPVGNYEILDYPENPEWYRLDNLDLNPRDDWWFFRNGFRLHPGVESEGCITVPRGDGSDWEAIQNLLENTSTETVNDRAGRLTLFRAIIGRMYQREFYGTLEVVNSGEPQVNIEDMNIEDMNKDGEIDCSDVNASGYPCL